MKTAMIANQASTPRSAPIKIPRALDCGPISGLRNSINVEFRRARMMLVSSNRLMEGKPACRVNDSCAEK